MTRAAGALIDVVASVSIAFPSNVARAVVLARPKMVACGIEVVTIVFLVRAYVDRMLTVLAIIGFALPGALVDDLTAVTDPFAHIFVTGGVVHAWVADTLVYIDITIATQCKAGSALLHITLARVLHNEAVWRVLTLTRITIILAYTVRKASHTRALVRMN